MKPGPFTVTTKRRAHPEPRPEGAVMLLVSRVAVATLEDTPSVSGVRGALYAMVPEETTAHEHDDVYEDIDALTESGGTVTLPDGTIIEVEAVSWFALVAPGATARYDDVQYGWAERAGRGVRIEQDLLLDAFNAREAER